MRKKLFTEDNKNWAAEGMIAPNGEEKAAGVEFCSNKYTSHLLKLKRVKCI